VEFTWDGLKNRAHERKHGASFETAVLVFDDPFLLSIQDREVEGEAQSVWRTL
jgi:uncharacterized protein